MRKATYGTHKENYKGENIYYSRCRTWNRSSYNLEGHGDFRTIAEARAAIDKEILEREARELAEAKLRVEGGLSLAAVKDIAAGTVTLFSSTEAPKTISLHEFRRMVFSMDMEIDWFQHWPV
jgi:hypothetical protein